MPSSRAPSPVPRGFTLVELMVVVALVGILAVIGVASFRREVAASKSSEAAAVVQAIRAAQETYRSEHQAYLDVSSSSSNWYPARTFGPARFDWRVAPASHPDGAAWALLNVLVTQPVQFRYLVDAGGPGAAMTTPVIADPPTWPTPTESWYVIQARADVDSDGRYCDALASSINGEIYIRNEGE